MLNISTIRLVTWLSILVAV